MSHQQQFRRGTVAQHATFTGAEAEVTAIIDASGTTRQLVIHDGQTQGGFEVLNARDVQELRGIYDPAPSIVTTNAPSQRLEVAVTPKPKGLANGLHVRFRMPSTNTGGMEIRINGDNNLNKAFRKEGGVTIMEAGDLLQNYVYLAVYDETLDRFILVGGGGGAGGGSYTRQIFTGPGSFTWTKPAGCQKVRARVFGGGGGGGGSGTQGTGGGGGGGGYSEKLIDVTSIVTESVTCGAGGAAGSGFGAGGAGGTSSFGAHCSATGGAPGQGQGVTRGGDGGTGSGGDLNGRGNRGYDSGQGGMSALGISSGGNPSSAGMPGIVLVEEFY